MVLITSKTRMVIYKTTIALFVIVLVSSMSKSCHATGWKCETLKNCTSSLCVKHCKERGFHEGGNSYSSVCNPTKNLCCCPYLRRIPK
uniref:Uncharacterized protein n=1 Tax=Avena sativa TaxID=4498 RepID=A0ACD5XRU8_AVESA